MADVAMGFFFAQSIDWRWNAWWDAWTLALLLTASSLLYIAGIILNDVFDLEIDRRQRPERPLPSGRIAFATASRLGWTLLVLGVLAGSATGFFTGHMRSGIVAALLATCILLYDAWLKRTPIGPIAMGTCRSLNVLLGMNVIDAPIGVSGWLIAGGLGIYVAGVTWLARHEADQSRRSQLAMSTVVIALGIAILAAYPRWCDRLIPQIESDLSRWYLLTGVLGLMIVWRCLWAVIDPIPARVRTAVAQCILSILMLDAVACYAVRGVVWAAMILLLLIPTMFFSRQIKMS
jgi:4-hydroxybenzoate polyprenyltransferase